MGTITEATSGISPAWIVNKIKEEIQRTIEMINVNETEMGHGIREERGTTAPDRRGAAMAPDIGAPTVNGLAT